MNPIFNFSRFKTLNLFYIKEKGSSYVAFLGFTTLVLFCIIFVFIEHNSKYYQSRYLLFLIFTLLNTMVFLKSFTNTFKLKNRWSHYLLIPASVFEKFLSFIFFIFLNLVACTIIFKLVDFIYVTNLLPTYGMQEFWNQEVPWRNRVPEPFNVFSAETIFTPTIIYISFLLESLVYMDVKNKWKIRLFGFLFTLFVFVFPSCLNFLFFGSNTKPNMFFSLPFQKVWLKTYQSENYLTRLSNDLKLDTILIYYLLPILLMLLVAFYFKLKEKEV
ncbi:hypothetical protein ACXGQW_11450 [Wenyingzhuangia sp. IMCC45533]